MVQINSKDSTKLQFRKLSDPDDSPLVSFYKHCFRYASPNLFIWGPLAPAHDALVARSAMARIQIAAGLFIFATTFRRYPSTIGKLRRIFVRATSFTCGSALTFTGARELTYSHYPNSNPLYVEIQLARELSLLDPANKGQPARGSYWFGPKNFMPMNNEQYWKMVYAMEVNEIMADQYLESALLTKYQGLLEKNYGENTVVELKADELTSRIEDIVHRDTEDQEIHHSLVNDKKNILFPLFENLDGNSKAKALIYWTRNNPFDALQLQEYKEFYAYMFPRMHFEADAEKAKK